MLKKARIVFATIFFILITLLFLDHTGTLKAYVGWMAKIQFLPAVLAANTGVVIALILVTLIFGRIYCSVVCPMGVLQDIIFAGKRKAVKKARMQQSYSKEKKVLRYGVLILFIILMVAGVNSVAILIAPYSAYGRIVSSISHPVMPVAAIAAVTLVVIVALALHGGRTWCNTICPVGTILGFFSRFAIFRIMIDTSKCVKCHYCEKRCKASCIDIENQKIDASRCVNCFDCIDNCKLNGLKYGFAYRSKEKTNEEHKKSTPDKGRRAFLVGSVILAGTVTAKAQEKHLDGGLAEVLPKTEPERDDRITPPGSRSHKEFYSKCTACQLCITQCPNHVLKPSTDLKHLMQPVMSYTDGYCRPECTVCSDVCPAGAILPITREDKTVTKIGLAKVNPELCISCAHCAVRCPAHAIKMVKGIPAVNESKCIGCGQCENLCPVRPISAIAVSGYKVHKTEE